MTTGDGSTAFDGGDRSAVGMGAGAEASTFIASAAVGSASNGVGGVGAEAWTSVGTDFGANASTWTGAGADAGNVSRIGDAATGGGILVLNNVTFGSSFSIAATTSAAGSGLGAAAVVVGVGVPAPDASPEFCPS